MYLSCIYANYSTHAMNMIQWLWSNTFHIHTINSNLIMQRFLVTTTYVPITRFCKYSVKNQDRMSHKIFPLNNNEINISYVFVETESVFSAAEWTYYSVEWQLSKTRWHILDIGVHVFTVLHLVSGEPLPEQYKTRSEEFPCSGQPCRYRRINITGERDL